MAAAAAKVLFVAIAIVASFSAHTVFSRDLITDANTIDHWIAGKHVINGKALIGEKLLDDTVRCPQEGATCVFGKNDLNNRDKCDKYDCKCVKGDYCTPNSIPDVSIPDRDPKPDIDLGTNPVIDKWIEDYWTWALKDLKNDSHDTNTVIEDSDDANETDLVIDDLMEQNATTEDLIEDSLDV